MNFNLDDAISTETIFQSSGGAEYLTFLQSIQPVKKWRDIVPDASAKPNTSYPTDKTTVETLKQLVPELAALYPDWEIANASAPKLGILYAFSRCVGHAHLVEQIDKLLKDDRCSKMVIEAGCYTGGFLHFLAHRDPEVLSVGFDISPVALDVASALAKELGIKDRTMWLQGNFANVRPEYLPPEMSKRIEGSIVVISNVIEMLGRQLASSPAIDPWAAKAGVVSYWTNQCATVVLSERHENPELLKNTILESGRWERSGTSATVLSKFVGPSTENMTEENPLGEWSPMPGCVMVFRPGG